MKTAMIAVAAGISLAALSGIESLGTVSRAQDSRSFGALRDLSLLKSDEAECKGTLVASGLDRDDDDDRDRDRDRYEVEDIQAGEERIFDMEHESLPWACLGETSATSGTMKCPSETIRVRITRDGDVAKFECYGRGD
jgi:hypothetical protein